MRGILSICLVLLSLAGFHAHAKGNMPESIRKKKDTTITEKFAIYYRFDSSEFDQSYLTNSETAAHIKNYLINSPRIDSITIYAWASPEGAYPHNVRLSQRRARTAKQFLLSYAPDSTKLNADMIRISPLAENWQGLEAMVVQNYRRHDREKVLRILRDKTIGDETRKWRLQQLDNGYTWKYMLRRYMPELRAATWVCVWAEVIDPLPEMVAAKGSVEVSSAAMPASLAMPQRETAATIAATERHTVLALRSNLLVPGLNAGLEVPLGNRWSVGADYYFPWIRRDATNRDCFQVLAGNIECRYWFGRNRTAKDRLKGHSIGLDVMGGYYDLERDYTGHQGEFINVGVDYLYALPAFKDRIHFEFTVGLGYFLSKARPYDVFEEGGKAYKEGYMKNFHWVGPNKLGISLVVPIKAKRRGEL